MFTIVIIFEQMSRCLSCQRVKVLLFPLVVFGGCRERLKIACIPQAQQLPQASFRSRISKDACIYPSLCMLFLTTQHPRSFLCLYSPEHRLPFTLSMHSTVLILKQQTTKIYLQLDSFILFEINLNYMPVLHKNVPPHVCRFPESV